MIDKIGKIKKGPIREVWGTESQDFTPWLEENIDALDDSLGLGLSNPQREQPAGAFRVDLLVDSDQGTIVVENQFGRSDHGHLGKLLTYLAVHDTQRAIWIVENPMDEHMQAVKTLNERGVGEVWLIKVEAVQIVDAESRNTSRWAPLFTVVVEPDIDDENKELQYRKNYHAEKFWTALFDEADNLPIPHSKVNARPTSQLDTRAISGQSDVRYRLAVNKKNARILLTNRKGKRLKVYDHLHKHRSKIDEDWEKGFGNSGKLEWTDDRGSGRWSIKFEADVGYEDESKWSQGMPELNRASVNLKNILEEFLRDMPMDDEDS